MKISTNLSWNTLARYAAMLWNAGEEPYTPNGDNLVELVEAEDDPSFVLDLEWLKMDCKWHVDKHFDMLEEEFCAVCHRDYLAGRRDKETVDGHNKYLKWRKEAREFKRAFKIWVSTAETVPEWVYDTDTAEFVTFPKNANGKAVPILIPSIA